MKMSTIEQFSADQMIIYSYNVLLFEICVKKLFKDRGLVAKRSIAHSARKTG